MQIDSGGSFERVATGAQDLTAEQRRQANDPENLLAAEAPNQQKSDADASDWLPSNTAYRCTTWHARSREGEVQTVGHPEKRRLGARPQLLQGTNPTKK